MSQLINEMESSERGRGRLIVSALDFWSLVKIKWIGHKDRSECTRDTTNTPYEFRSEWSAAQTSDTHLSVSQYINLLFTLRSQRSYLKRTEKHRKKEEKKSTRQATQVPKPAAHWNTQRTLCGSNKERQNKKIYTKCHKTYYYGIFSANTNECDLRRRRMRRLLDKGHRGWMLYIRRKMWDGRRYFPLHFGLWLTAESGTQYARERGHRHVTTTTTPKTKRQRSIYKKAIRFDFSGRRARSCARVSKWFIHFILVLVSHYIPGEQFPNTNVFIYFGWYCLWLFFYCREEEKNSTECIVQLLSFFPLSCALMAVNRRRYRQHWRSSSVMTVENVDYYAIWCGGFCLCPIICGAVAAVTGPRPRPPSLEHSLSFCVEYIKRYATLVPIQYQCQSVPIKCLTPEFCLPPFLQSPRE